jgi:hypothetical protein
MSAGKPRLAGGNRRRRAKGGALTEAQWQAQVVGLAGFYGWRVYHTHDSRRSAPGFPDLVLVRPPELIFAELKGESTRVTPDQEAWLTDLRLVGDAVQEDEAVCFGEGIGPYPPPTVDVYLWRAPDLDPVHERLARGRAQHNPIGAL